MTATQRRFVIYVVHALVAANPSGRGGLEVSAHHGDCRGADFQFHRLIRAEFERSWVVIHPPTDNRWRAWCQGDEYRTPADFLIRDDRMVEEVDLLIATPNSYIEQWRGSGTWATIRYAQRRRKPLLKIFPDGRVVPENFVEPMLGGGPPPPPPPGPGQLRLIT